MNDEVEAAEQHVEQTLGAFSLAPFESMKRQESGVWFTPTHPQTGKKIPWRILVAGVDSSHYKDAIDLIMAARAKKQTPAAIGNLFTGLDSQEMKDFEVLLASYISLDWEPLVAADGTPIPCNMRTKPSHFQEHRWLAEQVIAFCRNRGNFLSGTDGGAL